MSSEAEKGLRLFAGDMHLSDAQNALWCAIAQNPDKADLLWALIQDSVPQAEHKSFWGGLLERFKAGAAAVAVGVGLSTAAVAAPPEQPPTPVVEAAAPLYPAELPTPNLWTRIERPLKERVNEQNFEIWLSSCRASGDDGETLTLLVPNSHFEEYLGDHYTEVIEEALSLVAPRKVVFVARPQVLDEPPATPTAPKPKTRAEEMAELETKLTFGIPLDVLESDTLLNEIRYKRLEWRALNPEAFNVSNKLIELSEQYIARLRVLRERFTRRPTRRGALPAKAPPKRNDSPWLK